MSRNFDDYPGFQPFRSWANTYAQDCRDRYLGGQKRQNCVNVVIEWPPIKKQEDFGFK